MCGTINNPKCPYCKVEMDRIVPIVFQGDDVETFSCKNKECAYSVAINVKAKK